MKRSELLQKQAKDFQEYIKRNKQSIKLDRKRIFKRAHYLAKRELLSMSDALKKVWAERRAYVNSETYQELVNDIYHFQTQLLNMYTPQQYIETTEAQIESIRQTMTEAYKNGVNLNA